MRPLVSIITSNYNCGQYLGACIASVRAQTFGEWEHLILDAGSSDGSREVLHRNRHDRLVVRQSSRIPVSTARNELIRQARGDYIAILDADDVCVPERIARQLQVLASGKGIDAVGSRVRLRYTDGTLKLGGKIPLRTSEIGALYAAGINILPHSTLFVSRKILDKTGLYNERMRRAEDFDLIYRVTRLGSVACFDDCLIEYCMRNWQEVPEKRAIELQLNRLYVNLSILESAANQAVGLNLSAVEEPAVQREVSRQARRILMARCLQSALSSDLTIGVRCRIHLVLRLARTTLQIA